MTSRDFCFWLQGHLELSDEKSMSEYQLDILKAHLALVFKHEIDPSMGDKKVQEDLNKIHSSNISDFKMRC